jgi:DeoR family transcriptional regulator of aga operon
MKKPRQQEIRELLEQHGKMTVRHLATCLAVSEATIRRDLQELQGAPGLERTHGGVTLSTGVEPPVITRRRHNARSKLALAQRAAHEIVDGATIFIGSGSTMSYVAECVGDRRELNVITNAHNVAAEVASYPGATVTMTGGVLRKGEMSLLGPLTESTLSRLPFEVAFMSVRGVSLQHGLSNEFAPEASTDRLVVELAPRLIVVVEGHKLGHVAPIHIGSTSAIDLLITDADPDSDALAELLSSGVRVAHPA